MLQFNTLLLLIDKLSYKKTLSLYYFLQRHQISKWRQYHDDEKS